MMRTRWRLGSKRRFVATIEWLRWFPKPGFFPQIEQTLGTAANGSDSPLGSARRGEGRAELRERVGHLERRPCRLFVISPLKRLTTIATERRWPVGAPSRTA